MIKLKRRDWKMANKLIQTIIISNELLKIYSPVPLNMEEEKIYPFLLYAQEGDIKKILGDSLLQELIDEVESGVISTENQALIIKIAPALSAYACYYALPSFAYQIQQKGITKENSDNSTAIDVKELSYYRLDIKNQADRAAELLMDYLCSCSELYPLFDKKNCGCGNKVKENCNIYFPDKRKLGGCGCVK